MANRTKPNEFFKKVRRGIRRRLGLEKAKPAAWPVEVGPREGILILNCCQEGESTLQTLQQSVEQFLTEQGIDMIADRPTAAAVTRPASAPDINGARLVLCFGNAPRGYQKPLSSWMVQVLATIDEAPPNQLVTNRDCDLVYCLDSTVSMKLRELYPRKEVVDVSSAPDHGLTQLKETIRALGLDLGAQPKPVRAIKKEGPRLIDVYMTTSRRAAFFEKTLSALLRAKEATKHEVRLNVFADQLDAETLKVIEPHIGQISLLATSFQLGLPFLYNCILDHQEKVDARSERFADYLCYIQDDCLISNEQVYFDFMVASYEEILPATEIGYVSGFYCAIHPGFELRSYREKKVLLSDSIDGKNFMAPPSALRRVGPLSWHFSDGDRRGNPGPKRGSHFDLWQWKESPQALTKQKRVSIVIPGLCGHIAQSAEDSTWGNETSHSKQAQRREEGRIYKTRDTLPPVIENQF